MKYFLFSVLWLILPGNTPAQSPATEAHLQEAGTGPLCRRSVFAHGYRHGYEEGYHLGNIDVNLGQSPRATLSEFRGVSLHYLPVFGPQKSFEAGFQEGFKAGYHDGFAGRKFRAVDNLRFISLELPENPTPPALNIYFDQGIAIGYDHGLTGNEPFTNGAPACDPAQVLGHRELVVHATFCDGYQRGYLLGRADAIILRPEPGAVARK